MKNLFIALFCVSLLIPQMSKAQGTSTEEQYQYYHNQLYSYINFEISNSQNKRDLEFAINIFTIWQSEVTDAGLLDRLFADLTLTQYMIVSNIDRLAHKIQCECILNPQNDFSKYFEFKKLIEWGMLLPDVLMIAHEGIVQQLYVLASDCVKLKLNVQSTIIAKSRPASITGTIDSTIDINAEVSILGELTLEGRGMIGYQNIEIPPFSPDCVTDYVATPTRFEVLKIEGLENEFFDSLETLKVTFDPGYPYADLVFTCNGTSVPFPFDVWADIWHDLHVSERIHNGEEPEHFFLLQNWEPKSALENFVKKEYNHAKGDITEFTTIKLGFRE